MRIFSGVYRTTVGVPPPFPYLRFGKRSYLDRLFFGQPRLSGGESVIRRLGTRDRMLAEGASSATTVFVQWSPLGAGVRRVFWLRRLQVPGLDWR